MEKRVQKEADKFVRVGLGHRHEKVENLVL